MFDLGLSHIVLSDLVFMIADVIAALFCGAQVVRFDRLATEFKAYTAINKLTSASVVHAFFDHAALDEHQRIMRIEAIFAATAMAISLGWLSMTIAVTW